MKVEILEHAGEGAARPIALTPAVRRAPDAAFLERWRAHLQRLDAGAAVERNLDRLASGAACVVTGQQAGVLTGPLLTVLKAARAVSLARALEAESGRPIVPVFWSAADDHDLDEIHHTYVVNRAGELQKLRLELGGARGAAGEVAVPADGARLVQELWEVAGLDMGAFPPAPFLPRAGDSLSTWFSRCMVALLGEHGLVPFEPGLIGEGARPIFEQALRDDGAIARALQQGADALRARGLEAPLPVEADPPLFWIEPGARTHVRRRGHDLVVGERVVARDELLAHCGPGRPRLSANVALRPVLQAAALPALAYVAGPNEIVYYEQLKPLHELFGVPFPALVQRPQATVLSTAAARALRKLELPARELFAALDARHAAPAAKSPLLERGQQLRAEVGRYVDELLASSPAVNAAAGRRATQLLQSFDGLLERAAASHAEGNQVASVRWSALETLARPRGKPQDRSLNVLPFLAEHGRGLIDAFLTLDVEPAAAGIVRHALIVPE